MYIFKIWGTGTLLGNKKIKQNKKETKVIDLSKCNFLSIGEDGKWTEELKEA